jgi:hypothetical protein
MNNNQHGNKNRFHDYVLNCNTQICTLTKHSHPAMIMNCPNNCIKSDKKGMSCVAIYCRRLVAAGTYFFSNLLLTIFSMIPSFRYFEMGIWYFPSRCKILPSIELIARRFTR